LNVQITKKGKTAKLLWYWPKVGSQQISSTNRQCAIADLQILLDLWTFCKCGNLPFFWSADPFVISGPNFVCGLKTSANPQKHNFSPYKCRLQNLYDKFHRTSLRPNLRIKGDFAMKLRARYQSLKKRCPSLLSHGEKVCGFAISGLENHRYVRICYLRNNC
jgi:hypothetical protein